jgi:hypothetical protein
MSEKKRLYRTKVTFGEYARLCGVSIAAIRDRVERGTLKVEETTKTIIVRRINIVENPPENKTNPTGPRGKYKPREPKESNQDAQSINQ